MLQVYWKLILLNQLMTNKALSAQPCFRDLKHGCLRCKRTTGLFFNLMSSCVQIIGHDEFFLSCWNCLLVRSSNCQKVGYAPRRRSTGSSHTKSSNAEKTMQKDQNGHGNASAGPKTTSYKESNKPSPAVSNMFSNTCMQPQPVF